MNLGKVKKALDNYPDGADAQQALITRQIKGILKDLSLESRLQTDSVFDVLQMAKTKLQSTIKCADDITDAIDSIVESLKHVTRDLTNGDTGMSSVGFGDAAELLVFLNEQFAEGNTDVGCLTPQVNVLITRLHSLGVIDKAELDALTVDKKISSMIQKLQNYKELIAAANIVQKRRTKVQRASRVKRDKDEGVDRASAQALRDFDDLGTKLDVPELGKHQLLKALIHNLSLAKIERPGSSYEELMMALEQKFGVQPQARRSRSRSLPPAEPPTRSRSRSRTRAAQSPSPPKPVSLTRESALKTMINNDEFEAAREYLKAYTRKPNVTARDLKMKLHEVVRLIRPKIPADDASWQEWVASMNRTRDQLKQGMPKADLKPAYKNSMNLLLELESRQTLVDQEPLSRTLNKFKAIEEDDGDLIPFVKELQATKLPAAVFTKAPSVLGDKLRRMLGVLRDKTRRRIENSITRDHLGRVENPLAFEALSDRLDTVIDSIKASQQVTQGIDAQRAHLRKALLELGRLLADIEGEPLGVQLKRLEVAPQLDVDLLDRLKSLSDHPPIIVAGVPNAKQRELDAAGAIGKSNVYWAMSHVLYLVAESIRSMKRGEPRNRLNEWLNSVQNLRTNTQHDSKKHTADFEVPSQGLAFLINEVLQLARFVGRSNLEKVREQDIKQAWHGQKTYLYPTSSRRERPNRSSSRSSRSSSRSSRSSSPTSRRKPSKSPQRPLVSDLRASTNSRRSSPSRTTSRSPERPLVSDFQALRPLVSDLETPTNSRSNSPSRNTWPERPLVSDLPALRPLVSDIPESTVRLGATVPGSKAHKERFAQLQGPAGPAAKRHREVYLNRKRMAKEAARMSPQSPTLTYIPPKPLISPRQSPKRLITPRRESPPPPPDDYDPEYSNYNDAKYAVLREYSPTRSPFNNFANRAENNPTRTEFQIESPNRREYSPTRAEFQIESPNRREYSPARADAEIYAPNKYSPTSPEFDRESTP